MYSDEMDRNRANLVFWLLFETRGFFEKWTNNCYWKSVRKLLDAGVETLLSLHLQIFIEENCTLLARLVDDRPYFTFLKWVTITVWYSGGELWGSDVWSETKSSSDAYLEPAWRGAATDVLAGTSWHADMQHPTDCEFSLAFPADNGAKLK